MKIVHFLPWPNSNVIGGTEIFIRKIAESQLKLGHIVFIALPNTIEEENEIYLDGIFEYRFKSPNPKNSLQISNGTICPINLNSWINWLNKVKPTVLHVHAYEPYNFWYIKTAKSKGISIYVTPHVAQFTCITGSLLLNGLQKCDGRVDIKRCDQCIKTNYFNEIGIKSDLTKNILSILKSIKLFFRGGCILKNNQINLKLQTLEKVKNNSNKIIVLTNNYKEVLLKNGFEDHEVLIANYKMGNSNVMTHFEKSTTFKIAFIGRLSKEKGVNVLIESLKFLKLGNKRIELNLFGKDHEELSNIDEIIAINQSESIYIRKHGEVISDLLKIEFNNNHILCVPSTVYEMSPLVIQEAFLLGIPVIGSNIGGISEYICNGENGFLFESNNSYELSKVIQNLMDNPKDYYQIRSNVKKSLGFEELANDFVNIYSKHNNKIRNIFC